MHEENQLSIHSDMTAVVKAMANPESGLEVRDRMWLKITIPNAFIGKTLSSHRQTDTTFNILLLKPNCESAAAFQQTIFSSVFLLCGEPEVLISCITETL